MLQVIIDADGDFYVNKGAFPFLDPTNGVRFEPGQPVKVKPTTWLANQPVIEKQVTEKLVKQEDLKPVKPAK